jgi:hypothetical protein
MTKNGREQCSRDDPRHGRGTVLARASVTHVLDEVARRSRPLPRPAQPQVDHTNSAKETPTPARRRRTLADASWAGPEQGPEAVAIVQGGNADSREPPLSLASAGFHSAAPGSPVHGLGVGVNDAVPGFVQRMLRDPDVDLFRAAGCAFAAKLDIWRAQRLARGLTMASSKHAADDAVPAKRRVSLRHAPQRMVRTGRSECSPGCRKCRERPGRDAFQRGRNQPVHLAFGAVDSADSEGARPSGYASSSDSRPGVAGVASGSSWLAMRSATIFCTDFCLKSDDTDVKTRVP